MMATFGSGPSVIGFYRGKSPSKSLIILCDNDWLSLRLFRAAHARGIFRFGRRARPDAYLRI